MRCTCSHNNLRVIVCACQQASARVQAMVNDLMWQARMHSHWGHHRHRHHGGTHSHGRVDDWGRHPLYLQQVTAITRAARAMDGAQGARAGMSFGGGHSAGGGGGGW